MRKTLKQISDEIFNTMNYKQYFKWHNSQEQIFLDYKWQFETIKKSTSSKKIILLCNEGISLYDKTIKGVK